MSSSGPGLRRPVRRWRFRSRNICPDGVCPLLREVGTAHAVEEERELHALLIALDDRILVEIIAWSVELHREVDDIVLDDEIRKSRRDLGDEALDAGAVAAVLPTILVVGTELDHTERHPWSWCERKQQCGE